MITLLTILCQFPAYADYSAQDVGSADLAVTKLFDNNCAVCHGQDGAGKTAKGRKLKVADVRETVKKVTADDMIKIVQDGKGTNMDGYGKEFSKDQIKAIVEHSRGLAKQ